MSLVWQERLALVAILLILIGLPVVALGYEYGLRPATASPRVIDIRAAAPEAGGFQPDNIRVEAGETVTLRFHVVDVVHGIAIGPGLGIDLGHIDPGDIAEVTVTFPEAGTYTFYCNTWCSDDHWRMRGVIEVRDPDDPNWLPPSQPDPIIEALIAEGVDIDEAHTQGDDGTHMQEVLPDVSPSAYRGEDIIGNLIIPEDLLDPAWRFTHTPTEATEVLAGANLDASEADLVDAVAHFWVSDMDTSALAPIVSLYEHNCAACHGQTGNGNGPAADTTTEEPTAFADSAYMFMMRGDVLYAKIRRGGMGTDMPNFGTLFTQDETLALVDYLWVLAFAPEEVP